MFTHLASIIAVVMQYNGCKWLGGVLRVEPAKLHYTLRLAKEAAEDKAREHSAEAEASISPIESLHVQDMPPSLTPIHLPSRDGRKVSFSFRLQLRLVPSSTQSALNGMPGFQGLYRAHASVVKEAMQIEVSKTNSCCESSSR